jgi:hypothetical protein
VDIDKVCIAVEIEGKPYFVALEQDRMLLLMKMACGLSDNGQLNVVKAPQDFKFTAIGDLNGKP